MTRTQMPPEHTSRATQLIGANPEGAVRTLSLAARPFVERAVNFGLPVLIAVSGGADSTALAAVIIDHATRAGLTPHTLTVDHGLRAGSDREAEEVAALMTHLGARAHVRRVRVEGRSGPEANARDARRAALLAHVHENLGGRAAIFLGHTMNDQAETVLLRLARGSGVGSLRAMDEESGDDDLRWVRPLLSCSRRDTMTACRQLDLPWVNDPTNASDGPWTAADGSPLRRAALRDTLLPALANALGMDPIPALARTASHSARDDDALNAWAQRVWDEAEVREENLRGMVLPGRGRGDCEEGASRGTVGARQSDEASAGEGRVVRLRVRRLVNEPDAILARIAHRLASSAGYAPSAVHVERVCALIRDWKGQGEVNAPGSRIWRDKIAGEPHLCAAPSTEQQSETQARDVHAKGGDVRGNAP